VISFSSVVLIPVSRNQTRLAVSVDVALNGAPLCVIPEGYQSDGLSRPWWAFWKWRRFDARYSEAALLHDYLLDHANMPKWQIDWLFMGALRASGVSALEAGIFWLGVRTRRPGKAFRG